MCQEGELWHPRGARVGSMQTCFAASKCAPPIGVQVNCQSSHLLDMQEHELQNFVGVMGVMDARLPPAGACVLSVLQTLSCGHHVFTVAFFACCKR